MAATSTTTVRIGVIGVGRIGRMHAELLTRQVPGAAVTRVHDAHADSARAVADSLRVTAASEVEELLGAPDVDAVAICTSTDTHADLIVAAAQAGKAIFCEKPVSLDLVEVDRALAAVETAGVPFQIGFNRRFDAGHAAVAAAVAGAEVGDPQLARISSRDPAPPPVEYIRHSGGIFLDMTIHDFDMARFVTGSEVVEVYARGAVRIDPEIGEAGDVDTAVVLLEHANGCLTTIDNSRQAVYGYDQRVEVFGSAGMAASENPLAHSTIVRTAAGMRSATLPYFYLDRYIPSYLREWEAFVAAVATGETPPVSGADARAPLVIGMAAWRSLREGRPVRIEEVDPR
jgi:myo-inositol 2-dehydrogenase/D-chiro-inositol 1-dehydrogenase